MDRAARGVRWEGTPTAQGRSRKRGRFEEGGGHAAPSTDGARVTVSDIRYRTHVVRSIGDGARS